MSEYQYYEFQTIDQPLDAEQLAYLRTLSSRVQLTSSSAVFTYSYGNFRTDPLDVLRKHFDAMSLTSSGEHLILDIGFSPEEGGEWTEGEGLLSALVPLRNDLLQGDLRSLYGDSR